MIFFLLLPQIKLYFSLVQKTEFPGMHFREKTILSMKMPKFPTFKRIFQSGNTVSYRLMKGEKRQALHMSQKVDPFVRLLTILL